MIGSIKLVRRGKRVHSYALREHLRDGTLDDVGGALALLSATAPP